MSKYRYIAHQVGCAPLEIGIGVVDHRAKFQLKEGPTAQPDHFSTRKYVTSIIEFYTEGNN